MEPSAIGVTSKIFESLLRRRGSAFGGDVTLDVISDSARKKETRVLQLTMVSGSRSAES